MKKERIVSRVVLTEKEKGILKKYQDAKLKRFGSKILQPDAINDLIQIADSKVNELCDKWEQEMVIPEID